METGRGLRAFRLSEDGRDMGLYCQLPDEVVGSVEDPVWAGGADFHLGAAELMEKPRAVPRVAEFSLGVAGRALGDGEFDLLEVVSEQGGGEVAKGELEVVDGVEDELALLRSDADSAFRNRGSPDMGYVW